jgi:outer membrane protein assembly factor BamB
MILRTKNAKCLSLALALLLAACTKDDVIKPAELTPIKAEVKLQTLWSADAGKSAEKGYWTLRPAVTADRVYVSDQQGNVSAYTQDRGKLLWRVKLKMQVTAGVFADAEQVYVALISGELVALNAESGTELWRRQLSSEMLAPVARLSGYVVAQTIDGHVYALDSQSGEVLWRYDTVLPVLTLWGTSAPVIDSGLALVGFANGKLVALELTSGRLVWERWIGVPKGRSEFERLTDIDGQFWVSNDIIYVAGYQSRVAALSLQQGQPLWTRDLSSYVALTADAEALYVAQADGSISALDLQNGSVRWQQKALAARQLSGLAMFENHLLIGDLEGYLHVVSVEDGRFVGRTRISSAPLRVAPLISNEHLLVYSSDAHLKMLNLKNLKKSKKLGQQ